jgi:hypothetical protein
MKKIQIIKLKDNTYWLESSVLSWDIFKNQVLTFTSAYRNCFKNKLIENINKKKL